MERNKSRAWKPGIHLSHIAHNTLSLNSRNDCNTQAKLGKIAMQNSGKGGRGGTECIIANVNMLFFPSAIRKEDRTNINWLWTKPHTDLFPNYSATVSPYVYNPETFSLLTEMKYTPHFAPWHHRIIKKSGKVE